MIPTKQSANLYVGVLLLEGRRREWKAVTQLHNLVFEELERHFQRFAIFQFHNLPIFVAQVRKIQKELKNQTV